MDGGTRHADHGGRNGPFAIELNVKARTLQARRRIKGLDCGFVIRHRLSPRERRTGRSGARSRPLPRARPVCVLLEADFGAAGSDSMLMVCEISRHSSASLGSSRDVPFGVEREPERRGIFALSDSRVISGSVRAIAHARLPAAACAQIRPTASERDRYACRPVDKLEAEAAGARGFDGRGHPELEPRRLRSTSWTSVAELSPGPQNPFRGTDKLMRRNRRESRDEIYRAGGGGIHDHGERRGHR